MSELQREALFNERREDETRRQALLQRAGSKRRRAVAASSESEADSDDLFDDEGDGQAAEQDSSSGDDDDDEGYARRSTRKSTQAASAASKLRPSDGMDAAAAEHQRLLQQQRRMARETRSGKTELEKERELAARGGVLEEPSEDNMSDMDERERDAALKQARRKQQPASGRAARSLTLTKSRLIADVCKPFFKDFAKGLFVFMCPRGQLSPRVGRILEVVAGKPYPLPAKYKPQRSSTHRRLLIRFPGEKDYAYAVTVATNARGSDWDWELYLEACRNHHEAIPTEHELIELFKQRRTMRKTFKYSTADIEQSVHDTVMHCNLRRHANLHSLEQQLRTYLDTAIAAMEDIAGCPVESALDLPEGLTPGEKSQVQQYMTQRKQYQQRLVQVQAETKRRDSARKGYSSGFSGKLQRASERNRLLSAEAAEVAKDLANTWQDNPYAQRRMQVQSVWDLTDNAAGTAASPTAASSPAARSSSAQVADSVAAAEPAAAATAAPGVSSLDDLLPADMRHSYDAIKQQKSQHAHTVVPSKASARAGGSATRTPASLPQVAEHSLAELPTASLDDFL